MRIRKKNATSDYLLHHVCLSVCPNATIRQPTRQIFMKFDIRIFFRNPLQKFKFH